jgi:hypothetical protein
MRETPEELAGLQRALDRSMATNNTHLLAITTPDRRLSAEQMVQPLDGMHVLVVATVTAEAGPSRPAWTVTCCTGAGSSPPTRRRRRPGTSSPARRSVPRTRAARRLAVFTEDDPVQIGHSLSHS